eukprot:SAG31_NODE_3938_length_3735_cov_3.200220_6_plen_72_part_00
MLNLVWTVRLRTTAAIQKSLLNLVAWIRLLYSRAVRRMQPKFSTGTVAHTAVLQITGAAIVNLKAVYPIVP